MGAWDIGSFQNDSAMDWVDGFLENPGMDLIIGMLNGLIDQKGYIEVDEASAAVAAAEVVAAIKGNPSGDFPEDLIEFTKNAIINSDVENLAIQAVEKVWTESELSELWGMPDAEEMKNELLNRLK